MDLVVCKYSIIFRSGSLSHTNFLLCRFLWKAAHIFFMGWAEASALLCYSAITLLLTFKPVSYPPFFFCFF